MGEVLFDEALPDFLNPSGVENVRKRENCLLLETKAIQDEIVGATRLQYGNYALSNISDWLSVEEMNNLLIRIFRKSDVKFKMHLKYIHKNPVNEKITDMGYHFETLS